MKVLVIGASILDVAARPTSTLGADTSNEAEVTFSAGGAGRNVAENLARLGLEVTFVTELGDDPFGRFLLDGLGQCHVTTRLARRATTGRYVAILQPDGTLSRGYCQTGIEHVSLPEIVAVLPELGELAGVVLDANLSESVLAGLASRLRTAGVPWALDTVAAERARRVLPAIPGCALIKPDRVEARALTGLPCGTRHDAALCALTLRSMGAGAVLVSLGAEGLFWDDGTTAKQMPSIATQLTNVTGAGDALLATAFAGILCGLKPDSFLKAAQRAAALTCASPLAVSPEITPALLEAGA